MKSGALSLAFAASAMLAATPVVAAPSGDPANPAAQVAGDSLPESSASNGATLSADSLPAADVAGLMVLSQEGAQPSATRAGSPMGDAENYSFFSPATPLQWIATIAGGLAGYTATAIVVDEAIGLNFIPHFYARFLHSAFGIKVGGLKVGPYGSVTFG